MEIEENNIYEGMKTLEVKLLQSFQILPHYLIIVNVNEINSIISKIYNSVPKEIQDAREFLKSRNESGVYNLINAIEIIISKGFFIIPSTYIAVKVKEIETIIDRLYAILPTELKEARTYLGLDNEI